MKNKFCHKNFLFLGAHPFHSLRKWLCIFNIALLIYFLFMALYQFYCDKDLEALETLSCIILVMAKYLTLIFRPKLIRQIVEATENFWELNIIYERVTVFLKHLKRVENIYKYTFVLVLLIFAAKPLVVRGSSVFNCYVPPEIWYPSYYVAEMYTLTVATSAFLSWNVFVCFLIILVAVQFRLLNLKIKALNCEDVQNEHYFDRYVRDLKSVIQYQQNLMRYIKVLNELLHVPVALLMITSVFLMCLNMYALTTSKGSMVDNGRIMISCSTLIVEFFMVYGLPAQLLMDESEATADMVYFECKWYLPNLRPLRKHFLNMMTRSQKGVCIRAGNYHIINNRTILIMMKTAYSFYTFLQKVA